MKTTVYYLQYLLLPVIFLVEFAVRVYGAFTFTFHDMKGAIKGHKRRFDRA